MNVPKAMLEDFRLYVRLSPSHTSPNRRDTIVKQTLLERGSPGDRFIAHIRLPFPVVEALQVIVVGQHRVTGGFVDLRRKRIRLHGNGNDPPLPCKVQIDLRKHWAAIHRDWILARVHLPDRGGGLFSFHLAGCQHSGREIPDSGGIPVGASTVEVLIRRPEPEADWLSMRFVGPPFRPGICVYRSNASYSLPLTEIRVGEDHYVELWPRPCNGVLDIQIDRHPDVPAGERVVLFLENVDSHRRPRSMWWDPSQTVGDGLVRISWLPTATLKLLCRSESGEGLSVKVTVAENWPTQLRVPIAPRTRLTVQCTDLCETGSLRIVHLDTGHEFLGWSLTEIHKVPDTLYLPMGRYRLTFTDRWGRVQQKTLELKRPESVVRF